MTTTFKPTNDTAMRKRLFVPDAMRHPAKGHIAMWQEIIERYTEPGETIVDPMAGIGTSLVGALMGRNVTCVELENHFVEPMRRSWEKMRNQPMLGYEIGRVRIIHGDARQLGDLLADSVVTSPPYQEALGHDSGHPRLDIVEDKRRQREGSFRRNGYTQADHVVTSPPYEGTVDQQRHGIDESKWAPGNERKNGKRLLNEPYAYTQPDAIVTSPPYEGSIEGSNDATKKRIAEGKYNGLRPDVFTSPTNIAGSTYGDGYSHKPENIGNLRNDAYWSAMTAVYSECWRILKPGGTMALVLKGFTRNGEYIDLPEQTRELVEPLGFTMFDHWKRELHSLSFWRILQQRRDPEAFDDRLRYEEILAFRKI